MSNFIFTSHFQKRFENGNLTAVSEKDYSFQNIPIGYGDKTLANTVIDFCIDRVVSFEIVNQDKQRDKEPYVFKNRSKCIQIIYHLSEDEKSIVSIEMIRLDLGFHICFYEDKSSEAIPSDLLKEEIATVDEFRNAYPERLLSNDELEEEIERCVDRIETAQDYLSDEDDYNVCAVLRSKLANYRQTLSVLREEKIRRTK